MSFKRMLPRGYGRISTVLLALSICGCGGSSGPEFPRAAVSGTVTLDDTPLSEGVIRFVPTEGTQGPKTSAVISQGQFSLEEERGPVVGKHRIVIESTDNGGYALDDEEALQKLKASGVKRIDVLQVPAIYNSRSTLTKTISTDGPNEFTFDLKSNARR